FGNPGDLGFIIERSQPDCGIITNITPDHMHDDHDFLTYASIKGEFVDYLKDKKLIVNGDDPTVWGLITRKVDDYKVQDIITFGVDSKTDKIGDKPCWCGNELKINETISGMGDYHCSCGLKTPTIQYMATDITADSFTLQTPRQRFEVKTPLLGLHNIYNALGAIAAAVEFFNLPLDQIIKSIKHFNGVPGRLEHMGQFKGTNIIVDYAHNPGGVETVLGELKKVYEDLAVVITISSESGEAGDADILEKCLANANYVIPASFYSRKAADDYIKCSGNEVLSKKIIFPAKYPKEFKKGTLGANLDQITEGLKTGLDSDAKAVICIGEAAFKYKEDIKNMISQK
ncbi:MAG TPA: Mur ligase family protein, partial [Methanobacterium sp.]|nr:Mur ligase family protein [Methanobacterium sp.]